MTQQKSTGSGGLVASWRRWNGVERATVLGTVIGAVGLLVAILAWQWPRQPADAPQSPPANGGTGRPGGSAAVAPTTSGGGSSARPVLLAGQKPMAGEDKLVDIPLAVKERADYGPNAIAIRCPKNGTEPNTEVTYLLSGHYLRFDATVHPYYPPGSDVQSVTHVTALVGVRQRDGSLDTEPAGAQPGARPGLPGALSATVQGAERLILRVECDDPAGVVLLTDARLAPAAP